MNFEYYYNTMPNGEQWRNNLIYTSLIDEKKKVFVQWYKNDSKYHQGQNQVVDPALMDAKWEREMHFLHNMAYHNPDMVPKILDVNVPERMIYLSIDGPICGNVAWMLIAVLMRYYRTGKLRC